MVVKKILKHFARSDPILYQAARAYGLEEVPYFGSGDYFARLCRAIVGQQLSVKAAATINGRFLELLGGELRPKMVLATEDEEIRKVGLSAAKTKYVKDLARHVVEGLLELDKLAEMKNQEVMEELVAVKGIGQWTAEMFLMFTLGREDVFSARDLGLRRAMEKLYDLKPSNFAVYEQIATHWSPYRTYACRVLWKTLDNDPQI